MFPSWVQPHWRNQMTFLFLASKHRLFYLFPKPVNLDEKILHWGAFSSQILPVFHLEEGLGERAQSRASFTGCVSGLVSGCSHAGSICHPFGSWIAAKQIPRAGSCPPESAEKHFAFQKDLILVSHLLLAEIYLYCPLRNVDHFQ